jgi:PIN domain nuclease of toxin-antitoxin system
VVARRRTPLADDAREAIADPSNLVVVSAASAWEIAIKQSVGKLSIHDDVVLEELLREEGFEKLPIGFAHAREAGALPPHHRDPFDRMLVAQARLESLVLVTRDPSFDPYDLVVLAA